MSLLRWKKTEKGGVEKNNEVKIDLNTEVDRRVRSSKPASATLGRDYLCCIKSLA